MRILVIADRAPSRRIPEILADTPADLIITLGDLEMHQIRSLELVDLPKLGVYGNHCSGMYMDELGIQNMHMQTVTINGVTFGGFEGCVRYKQSTAPMYTQEEASALLTTFPRVDVILTHCPPFGINDDQSDISHTGFLGLRDYVEREKPAFLFHGHTYPAPGAEIDHLGSTKIVYVFGEKIVVI